MRLIDADALVERYGEPCHSFLDVIEDMPTIDPVVHARWDYYLRDSYCSACGYRNTPDGLTKIRDDSKFCPFCGARMDGEEE